MERLRLRDELLAQLVDLIAQERRLLELQVLRGRLHLAFQVFHQPRQLVLGDVLRRDVLAPLLSDLLDVVGDVADRLVDALRRDALLRVVRLLHLAAPVRLVDRRAHRIGHDVRVHDRVAVEVAGGAAHRLDQRVARAEEALLVGVHDHHQAHLGQVEPLAQQVDTDDHVVHALPQVAQDLDALQRFDLRVQVVRADAHLLQVVGQVLGHLLRQRRHQHPLFPLDTNLDLLQQVIDLMLRRLHFDRRVEQARRPHELLDDLRADLVLVRAGRRGRKDHLVHVVLDLTEVERAVVHRGGQPEAEVDQRLLARHIAVVHAARLRHRDVRLVDHEQPVVREVVEQRPRRAAGAPAGEVARVVLDARAVAGLAHRLDVVTRALLQPRRLQDAVERLQLLDALLQLLLDVLDRQLQLALRCDEVLRRVDINLVPLGEQFARERVDLDDALHLVAEEIDADGQLVVGGLDREAIAPHAELAAHQVHVVALVLHVDQAAHGRAAVEALALLEREDERLILLRLAETVDAGDRRDDQHIAALEQRARGRVAQLVDLVVDVGVLGDVGVGAGDVRFRLVVVVVRDEELDRVLREELLVLGAELRGQCPIRRQDERRHVDALDDARDRECLAAAGHTQERLEALACGEPVRELVDRLRLVAGRLEVGDELEIRHRTTS